MGNPLRPLRASCSTVTGLCDARLLVARRPLPGGGVGSASSGSKGALAGLRQTPQIALRYRRIVTRPGAKELPVVLGKTPECSHYLGRSLRALIAFVADLQASKVEFRSLSDSIDTGTAAGRFFFHVMAALAEMERDLIRKRTKAGLAASRARGRKGGRKPKLTAAQIEHAHKLLADKSVTIKSVAETFGVNRATIYRALGLAGSGD